MNHEPRIQALMLSALYGELSEAERAEWEAVCDLNPALTQEFERLSATISKINDSETQEEESVFFEEQWKGLQGLTNAGIAPVQIVIPSSAIPQKEAHQKKATIFYNAIIGKQRKYWAVAATIVLMFGAGASVYRWQFGEVRQASLQELGRESSTSNNAPSTSSDALPLADKPTQRKQDAIISKSEASSDAAPRLRDEKQPQTPTNQRLSDEIKENTMLDRDGVENDVGAVQKSKQAEERKQAPAEKEASQRSDEAEYPSKKHRTEEEIKTKDVIPSGFQDKMLFQNAPQRIAPQQAPAPSLKPASILPSARGRVFSTNATIKADSTPKRDSAFPRK